MKKNLVFYQKKKNQSVFLSFICAQKKYSFLGIKSNSFEVPSVLKYTVSICIPTACQETSKSMTG